MSIEIPGFANLLEIHRSPRSLVLRGMRSDGQPVVLKTTGDRRPSRRQVGEFLREQRLTAKAQGSYVVDLLDGFELEGAPVLVLEDFGGCALREISREALSLDQKLHIALELARAAEAVHGRGILHKDINPANVVWNADTATLKLIDFGIASDLTRELLQPQGVAALEGTLQYLAPEQTGWMNRAVDRRSDLYSIGITLYELFAGVTPFAGDDVLALVHAQVARPPLPLRERNSDVPEPVADIVMRLLAKDPQDRYQTAAGLAADLETCVRQRAGVQPLRRFRLGSSDHTGQVEIPEKLYGRAGEVDALLGAFELAATGGRELVLVCGAPGIGKTALVREVYHPIAERRGDFLDGKFDQFRLGVPYAPIAAAFGQFLRRVLTQSDLAVQQWRATLEAALGRNASVLGGILPELEALLGPQAPPPELAAAEAENRLHMAFRELVEAIASEEHPIVLFLDDLQWADVPSLRLIERLATDADCRYLLLIGAYRDGEVDAAHPLALTLGNCRRNGCQPTEIVLAPLQTPQILRLLRDTFDREDAELRALADLCRRKTDGNPFFLKRFLQALGEQGIAVWVAAKQRWEWRLDEAEQLQHSENVLRFLFDRFQSLPDAAQSALQQAACIGNEFDLRLLAAAAMRTPAQLQQVLQPAVSADLIAPRGKGWVLGDDDASDAVPDHAFVYRFVHDNIQQAAYASLSEERARHVHQRLGDFICAQHRGESVGAWLFEVANHLNRAAVSSAADSERASLAQHNLDAGRQAKRAAAFGPAADYFEAGIRALPDNGWEQHYALALGLNIEAAECAYLNANTARMSERIETVKAKARSLLDGIKALEIEMEGRLAQDEPLAAVHVAMDALDRLGASLPRSPTEADVGAAVQRAMASLSGLDASEIEALPDVESQEVAATQRIMVRACSAAYYAMPALLPILACDLVVSSVQRGLSPATPFAFAVYGLVINSIGLMPQAHDYGALAERLLERWPDRRLEARTRLVVNNHILPWIAPLQSKLDNLREAYRIGRDSGDLEYAAICAQCYCTDAFSAGRELTTLLQDCERFTGFMRNYQQTTILRLHAPLQQLVRSLCGLSADPRSLNGPDFDEQATLDFAAENGNASLSFVTLSDMLVARFHFASAEAAHAVAEAARPLQQGAVSTYHLVNFHTYAPLVVADLYALAPEADRPGLRAKLEESLTQLQAWAVHGPGNHRHRALLAQAEAARIDARPGEAEALFLQALDAVRATEYLNDEALIAERAARFFEARGGVYRSLARAFLQDAVFAYQRWGASAKASSLEAEFPLLLSNDSAHPQTVTFSEPGTSTRTDVDAMAVVKSARAMSAEIELDKLLLTIFRTIIEAGGAQRALLLLPRERWQVVMEGTAEAEPAFNATDLDRLDDRDYPVGLLRFVLRTRRDVVIDDASRPGNALESSRYRKSYGVRSALCLPVQHRGELAAILYLDHSDANAVFTAARCELLQLLMSQAVVSLRNSQLFEAQKELTRAQARFVPHQFLDSLGHRYIAEVQLGDAVTKTMSVCFSDLRHFTTLVESLGGASIIALLNSYFAAMEPAIAECGGFIDSFNGDGIMALFDGDPVHAVRAGVQMQAALRQFNESGGHQLAMGIGVDTGPLVLGTVGGRDRIKCGVVGDAVNRAARIESLTKRYGARLLLGEETLAALVSPNEFSLRVIDRVVVKGRQGAQNLIEVLDALPDADRRERETARESFEQAMRLYLQREFAQATQGFREVVRLAPGDLVPGIFLERCQRYLISPPSVGWQGEEWLVQK